MAFGFGLSIGGLRSWHPPPLVAAAMAMAPTVKLLASVTAPSSRGTDLNFVLT